MVALRLRATYQASYITPHGVVLFIYLFIYILLLLFTQLFSVQVQVGIVSYGPPLSCGGANPSSVFTRVTSFNAAGVAGPAAMTSATADQAEVDFFIGSTLAALGVAPITAAGAD